MLRRPAGRCGLHAFERCQAYLFAHPIRLSADEIDELYLRPLRDEMDEYEERHAWQPVISRDAGAVALEIAPTTRLPCGK